MKRPPFETGQTAQLENISDRIQVGQTHTSQTMVLEAEAQVASSPLEQAITTAQRGNAPLARLQLEQAIKSEPNEPSAWLWFAWIADSPTAAISALEKARQHGAAEEIVEAGLAFNRALESFPTTNDSTLNEGEQSTSPDAPSPNSTQELRENTQEATSTSHLETNDITSTSKLETQDIAQDITSTSQLDSNDSPEHSIETAIPAISDEAIEIDVKPATGLDGSRDASHTMILDASAGENVQQVVEQPIEDEDVDNVESRLASFTDEVEDFFESFNADSTDEQETAQESVEASDETETTSSEQTEPAEGQQTIVVVDDSATIRQLVTICLEKSGYFVITAADGMEALKPIKERNPALILMDINMPRLNGYQLCKLVKQDANTRSIPVLMLSGKDGVFDKFRGKMSGCDGYITKPFEADDLQAKVAEFLTVSAS